MFTTAATLRIGLDQEITIIENNLRQEEKQPVLNTNRLTLRPFRMEDAPDVRQLAGDIAVAATTLNIPHPYEEGLAEAWIATHREKVENGEMVVYAVTLRDSDKLVGAISIAMKEHDRGEMGYWIGKPYWNQGYATESARAMIALGFEVLGLNKISASHLVGNPASGRVMEKAGMEYEGCSPQHVKKWGEYKDLKFYGLLRENFTRESRHPDQD